MFTLRHDVHARNMLDDRLFFCSANSFLVSHRPVHHSTTYETKSKLKRVVILGLADSPKSIIVNGEGRLKKERQRI